MHDTLQIAAVCTRVNCRSRGAIYNWMRDRGFPRPIKAGGKALWLANEVDAWLAARIADRDSKLAADAARQVNRAIQQGARA